MPSRADIEGLLIDTWWFGLTHRIDEQTFLDFARQRVGEGFNAVQMVVGIPPEVAPQHPEAASDAGVAWTLKGQINADYLELARRRIEWLNAIGLTVVVYGAWGMQIDWMGTAFMQRWWRALVEHLDDLNVVYCVTGEADLWIATPRLLLPDRSTDDLHRNASGARPNGLHRKLRRLAGRAVRLSTKLFRPNLEARRRQRWGEVLLALGDSTRRPIVVHPSGHLGAHSHTVIDHSDRLATVTVQTGHSPATRNLHWQLPLRHLGSVSDRFINLEPWYEGILDNFWTDDQLFAYWCNMLAGACSFAYGAHGVWNLGDGRFLAHWGKQTLQQARALPTPGLLGQSHALWLRTLGYDADATTEHEERDGVLLRISRNGKRGRLSFYPDGTACRIEEADEYYLPGSGETCDSPPATGAVVAWRAAGTPA